MGGEGSLFVSKDKAFMVKGFKVQVKSTVGAGDSMVTALASAVSTAAVITDGSQPGRVEDIEYFLSKIEIENIVLKPRFH